MDNRFVFIIPFRNVRNYIQDCYNSILSQNYKNWIAIFCDDESNDGTSNLIPDNPNFVKIYNQQRVTALPNIHYGIMNSNLMDDDIICLLDGDDFLLTKDVLDIINNLYQDPNCWLTYGQYAINHGNNQWSLGHCQEYTKESFDNLRKGGYWASHLRTFKYHLYKRILEQDPDLKCYKDKNGDFYKTCYDVAIMTPLMEMAGLDRIKFNPNPVYFYRLHPNNDHSLYGLEQKQTERELFEKNPFNRI
jgi:glycosyltransferase involved in cell wall biosynthesis